MLRAHKKREYATKEDRATHELFCEAGVIVGHDIEMVEGQQTCSWCADGFRPHMRADMLEDVAARGGEEAFFHAPAGNGDAMRFAYNSPLSAGYSDHDNHDILGKIKTKEIVESIWIASRKSISIRQHIIVHHWPCTAGTSRNISYAESIDLVIRGKHRIKHQIRGLKVAINLFIDWSEDETERRLIKMEPYLRLIEADPRFRRQHDEWQQYVELMKKKLPVLIDI